MLLPDRGFGIRDDDDEDAPLAAAPVLLVFAPAVLVGMVRFCVLCVRYVTVVVGLPPTVRCSVSMVVKTSGSLLSDMSLPATLGGRELRELARELVRLAVTHGGRRECEVLYLIQT